MGTNFYLSTKNKETRDKYFGYNYNLTDTPDWGYEIHIAKTSGGWLPLFQKHNCIQSVKDIKRLYETGEFVLYDEYGTVYDWPEFEERVVKFNGGYNGAIPKTKYQQDPNSPWHDRDMPNHTPVSHFEYGNGKHSHMYTKDEDGFEFMEGEFS